MSEPAPARSVLPDAADDEAARQQVALRQAVLVTVQHFFGGCGRLFGRVSDPRQPAHITYPLPAVLATGAWLFLLRLGARRQVTRLLCGNGPSAATVRALFGGASVPHGDTLEATCQRMQAPEVQEVVTATVKTRIRQKVRYPQRLCERAFLVTIDGIGRLTFAERHCAQGLTLTQHGHTTYYHPLLQAKLVTHAGLGLAVLTEFSEHPSQYASKQACVRKAC